MSNRHLFIGVFVSLGLHVALAVFLFGFSSSSPEKAVKKTPNFVKAELVKLKSSAKKAPTQQAAKKKPKVVDLTKKRKERERLERKRKAEQKRKRELAAKKERERKAAEKKKQEALAEAERQRQQQKQQQLKEQALLAALEEEDEFLEAQSMEDMAQSYVAAMAQRIEQNWSRPPSARRGMECILSLQLVPNGKVVNVDVIKSSGNAAFDRSAVQAVRKVERFTELKGMDSATFERHFRQLQLKFNPQDLRL